MFVVSCLVEKKRGSDMGSKVLWKGLMKLLIFVIFFLLSKLSLYFERFWATLTLAPFTFISNSIYLALCQRQTVAKLIEKVPISSRTNTNKPEVVFCYCQTTAFLEWFYSRIISYTIDCSNQTPWLCSSHCVYLEGVTRFWRSWDITVKPTWLI